MHSKLICNLPRKWRRGQLDEIFHLVNLRNRILLPVSRQAIFYVFTIDLYSSRVFKFELSWHGLLNKPVFIYLYSKACFFLFFGGKSKFPILVDHIPLKSTYNRPFATNDHMVQNPPYWRASSLLFPHWDVKTKRP